MKYRLVFSKRAAARLAEFPPLLASGIYEQVEWVMEDPENRGSPAFFPHPPRGRIHDFVAHADGDAFYCKIFWTFLPDQRVLVNAVTAQPMAD